MKLEGKMKTEGEMEKEEEVDVVKASKNMEARSRDSNA